MAQAQLQSGDPTPGNPVICNANLTTPQPPTVGSTFVCSIPNPNPPSMPVLWWTQTWLPPSNPVWTPNREPAAFIQMWNGSFGFNPFGLATWWGPEVNSSQYSHAPGTPPISFRFVDEPRDLGALQFNQLGLPIGVIGDRNGRTDQIEFLEWYLNMYADEGFKRIILKLPGGSAFGPKLPGQNPQDFTMNQWQLMPEWKQKFFKGQPGSGVIGYADTFLSQWLANRPGMRLDVYVGAALPLGQCTPCYDSNQFFNSSPTAQLVQDFTGGQFNWRWVTPCFGVPKAEDYRPWERRQVNQAFDSLQPWIEAGFRGFWLDAGQIDGDSGGTVFGRRRGTLELFWTPHFRDQGVSIGGETFPDRNQNGQLIDDCSVAYAPWFGLAEVATNFSSQNNQPPTRTFKQVSDGWLFNRSKSEMLFAAASPNRRVQEWPDNPEPPLNFNDIGEARKRGFVVALYNCNDATDIAVCEAIKRWYSMGWIYIADFNGDGIVNQADKTAFDSAISLPDPEGYLQLNLFAEGDVNQNNIIEGGVNGADRLLFHQRWDAHVAFYGAGTPVPSRGSNPAGWVNFMSANDK